MVTSPTDTTTLTAMITLDCTLVAVVVSLGDGAVGTDTRPDSAQTEKEREEGEEIEREEGEEIEREKKTERRSEVWSSQPPAELTWSHAIARH